MKQMDVINLHPSLAFIIYNIFVTKLIVRLIIRLIIRYEIHI